MKMPALQNRARGRQRPHRDASQQKREFCERLAFVGIAKQLECIAREPLHQEQIENKHDDVEQQAAIFCGEQSFGGRSAFDFHLVSCRYLMRWGISAAAPRRVLRSASYSE